MDDHHNDLAINRPLLYGIIGVVLVLIVLLYMADLFTPVTDDVVSGRTPSVQSTDLQELHVRENEELTTYKLLDSTTGTYRIPIDSAIELLVEESNQ
ncbi:MAG: hypothetical protein JW763_09715 [candidate division Zixibacteria bacterium]|nr:hypothetical protein [candidate division Zixibacteria bacterium]